MGLRNLLNHHIQYLIAIWQLGVAHWFRVKRSSPVERLLPAHTAHKPSLPRFLLHALRCRVELLHHFL